MKKTGIFFVSFTTFIIALSCLSSTAFSSVITTKNSTNAYMYGFIDYEAGWNTKSLNSFYKSNTSHSATNAAEKTSFSSRTQVRIGLKLHDKPENIFGNIAMDSWPNDTFNLVFAYIKHPLSKHISITIGKNWSLVNQRYFHFSCYTFKPYPAGFNGSKRNTQIKVNYKNRIRSSILSISVATENRNNKDGIVIGKNISSDGTEISTSSITSERRIIPASVINAKLKFNTGLGKPSKIMAYYEISPVYLNCANREYKETAYLYSIASKINIDHLTLAGQYLYTSGMSGIAGISGNGFKTYSYINIDGKIIKRTSNTWGIEAVAHIEKIKISTGYSKISFSNSNSNNNFVKNEVKDVKTFYIMSVFNLTKTTKLFAEWDNIKTKYALSNTMSGNFDEAVGNQFFMGYRLYF